MKSGIYLGTLIRKTVKYLKRIVKKLDEYDEILKSYKYVNEVRYDVYVVKRNILSEIKTIYKYDKNEDVNDMKWYYTESYKYVCRELQKKNIEVDLEIIE